MRQLALFVFLALMPLPAAAQAPKPPEPAKQAVPPKLGEVAARDPNAEIIYDEAELPARVAQTRHRIIEAAKTGDMPRLLVVMEMNEMKPIFTRTGEKDPAKALMAASADPNGREMMAQLVDALLSPGVKIRAGTPQEMYVWPYFAETSITALAPEDEVMLWRLARGRDVKGMREANRYKGWRIGIGPDGTWHYVLDE